MHYDFSKKLDEIGTPQQIGRPLSANLATLGWCKCSTDVPPAVAWAFLPSLPGGQLPPRHLAEGARATRFIYGSGQARPRHHRALPGRDHAVWTAFPQKATHFTRLLSGGPKYSLVGDCAFDRRRGNQHADHHRNSRSGLRHRFHILAG